MTKKACNIRVRDGGMDRLRQIAGEFGAVSKSGVRAGEASISELLDRVISGELVIVERERTMDKQQVNESITRQTEPAVVLGPTGLETGPGWDALEAEGEANLQRAMAESRAHERRGEGVTREDELAALEADDAN